MKVVILCGGRGTRIRDLEANLPKPMISIGNRPILWHIMKYYASWGFTDFVLCAGYKSETIKQFFLDYDILTRDITLRLGHDKSVELHGPAEEHGWSITIADTGLEAMTGARIARIKRYIGNDETFLLTYGDGLSDVDIGRLVDFHHQHGKLLTVTGVRPPGRFGEMDTAADGRVIEFNEKPQATGGLISGGFFVCNRALFDYLPDDEGLVFEQAPMNRLVEKGQLMVYRHDGFWQCMDTFRDHTLLSDLWEGGRAPWLRWS